MIMCKRLFDWSHLSISINGTLIPPSLETLFLGLTIDCRLKWNSHITNKIAAAKRAFFTLRSGLKSTWGFDKKRLKFLYHSAVEPILLYGCSVWASFLNTKKGTKQLRTFQRSIALSLASSFKTVSAEACFILTNILPIDLRVQEITHLRFSSGCTERFSAASLKWLTSKLPPFSPLLKCDSIRRHFNHYWPPWAPPLNPTLISDVCSLLPTKDSVLRIFVAISRSGDSFNCCIIFTCHDNVLKVTNGPLSADSLHRARQLSVLHALIQASHVVESGWQVEIFAQHISSFAFARYGAHLSEIEWLCVDATAPYRDKLRLFICQPSSAEGIQLALAGCEISGSGLNALPQLATSKTSYRHTISKLVRDAWQTEWQACYNGQLTREFSPTVQSATVLHPNKLCHQVAQILSGHSFLKEHQFRFSFTTSPKCDCGADSESVSHFLFHCPLFSTQRLVFLTSCSSEDGHWPRPLASIPAHPYIWKAFIAFVRSTKRLRWNNAQSMFC